MGLEMLCLFPKKKKKKTTTGKNVKSRSSIVEELISSSGGLYNPIRSFSFTQIHQATNNFDENYKIAASYGRFVWYKGMIEDRSVLIKKYEDFQKLAADNIFRDISVSSMINGHKYVLKLLGYCLEFPLPVLVCEYPENGSILNCLTLASRKLIPWNLRIKIAKEIAEAVTCLHTIFPKTIIHRDLDLANVFLDENWRVKLSSFSLSICIPKGKSGVHDIVYGTYGYTDPDYISTCFVTEKVDIYSLGIIMLVLLTGKIVYPLDVHHQLPVYVGKLLEQGLFSELIDPSMFESPTDVIPEHLKLQMEAFLDLALKCVRKIPEEVLHMEDVATELTKIQNLTV